MHKRTQLGPSLIEDLRHERGRLLLVGAGLPPPEAAGFRIPALTETKIVRALPPSRARRHQGRIAPAQDVSNAIAAQNQILPAGTVKFGATQYTIKLNDAPAPIDYESRCRTIASNRADDARQLGASPADQAKMQSDTYRDCLAQSK